MSFVIFCFGTAAVLAAYLWLEHRHARRWERRLRDLEAKANAIRAAQRALLGLSASRPETKDLRN